MSAHPMTNLRLVDEAEGNPRMGVNDDYTQAEIVRTLSRIETSMEGLRAEVKASAQQFVPSGEFEAWRTGMDREIKQLQAARAPWWSVSSVVISVVTVAVVLLPYLAR